jgi:predicted Zn-dependent protease
MRSYDSLVAGLGHGDSGLPLAPQSPWPQEDEPFRADRDADRDPSDRHDDNSIHDRWEQAFGQLTEELLQRLRRDEHVTLTLSAEQSQFTRFNRAKVRQSGTVSDGTVTLTLMRNQRRAYRTLPFTGDLAIDLTELLDMLGELRLEVPQLPIDSYLVLPEGEASSRSVYSGQLLGPEAAIEAILAPVADLDFTGIYAAGLCIRAQSDSAGQFHWFATEGFTLDYSIFDGDRAIKGTFADRHWDGAAYADRIAQDRSQLQQLRRPIKVLEPGHYRTYLAPAAVAELILMMSWECLSEAAIRQGGSPMELLRQGDRALSPQFSLRENFGRGLVPQFNEEGEVAPLNLPLIDRGQLSHTLINGRTAKEYDLPSNGADHVEDQRAPELDPGDLSQADVLKALGTGLYLSNLHYLNWSDRPAGRITGMTRYACFWVEDGEIVAPIENMRFDDTIFRFFGSHLMALTREQSLVPKVDSYDVRSLGGTWTPGLLIEGLAYTL